MDKTFPVKNCFRKMIVCASAAVLLTAAPVLSIAAAEPNTPQTQPVPPQTTDTVTDTTGTQPPQNIPPAETPLPPTPADGINAIPPQTPSDPTTDTLTSETAPADQVIVEVTPMQTTVYASSQKGLNVRSGPSTTHSKLGTVKHGQAITVTGITADNWYQIQYAGGVGYVLSDFTSSTPPASTEKPAVDNSAAESPVVEPEPPSTDIPATSG